MTCDECNELLVPYALDSLSSGDRAAVQSHLGSGCEACARSLSEFDETQARLPMSLPPLPPSPAVRSRLLARIASPESPPHDSARGLVADPTATRSRRPRAWRGWVQALVAGAVAAALTAGVSWSFLQRQRATIALLQAEVGRQRDELQQLRRSIQRNTETIALFSSPAVQLVSLQGTPAQPKARARVYWDQEQNAWHVYAANLAPLAGGKTYELWLINSAQRKVPAGTFEVNPLGQGSITAAAPTDAGRVVAVAVTDEPAGGSPQPTGKVQLLGEVR
jgi:anti-sigma-K factor RskA